jgi:hypothetical protein
MTSGNRVGIDWRVIQMEELECHIVNLENNLAAEMRSNGA